MEIDISIPEEEPIKFVQFKDLYESGLATRAKSRFPELFYAANEAPMEQTFVEEWVSPFYMGPLAPKKEAFAAACVKATPEITLQLLREVNWRPRIVAARIIAVSRIFEMQEEMSNIFMKSEVCCVGHAYCLTLTRLANQKAVDSLRGYLDYYLRTTHRSDQSFAMAALLYLDRKQGTQNCGQFGPLYKKFYPGDAENARETLKSSYAWICNSIRCIEEIEQLVQNARNRQ